VHALSEVVRKACPGRRVAPTCDRGRAKEKWPLSAGGERIVVEFQNTLPRGGQMPVVSKLRSWLFSSIAILGVLCECGFAAQVGQRNQNSQPSSLRQLFVPYWAVGDGYHSVAQLHNNLINTSLVVHAAVFAADGTRVELGDVQLTPLGNAQIDIEYALLQQGQTIIRSGSAVFEYQSRYGRALGAEISVSQPAKTLSYTITGSEKGASPADLAAVYWLPSDRAEAYIALQNTSSVAIEVTARFEANGSITSARN